MVVEILFFFSVIVLEAKKVRETLEFGMKENNIKILV